MKKEITLIQFIGIIVPLASVFIGWCISITSGLNVERTRNDDQDKEINYVKDRQDVQDRRIDDKLDQILREIGEKEDRR